MQIKEVIVVEGKSDTMLLKSLFDCDTIETNGSAITKDTIDLIREMNQTRGVILFLDPDYPGMRIRNMILQVVPNCKQAFLNKKDAIGKGKVGIAEGDKQAIKKALLNSVSFDEQNQTITWQEFISLDIIGNKKKREFIYSHFHLGYGNNKLLFKRLNMASISKEIIEEVCNESEPI